METISRSYGFLLRSYTTLYKVLTATTQSLEDVLGRIGNVEQHHGVTGVLDAFTLVCWSVVEKLAHYGNLSPTLIRQRATSE